MARVSDMQQLVAQLQEEKSQALKELEELKRSLQGDTSAKIKSLQREVEKTKESERKMLESMISQTKQLEKTKIELEESKLEMRNLKEKKREFDQDQLPYQSKEDIGNLRRELRLASEAEEKNKKALDNLALTLKEVTTEMNGLREKLAAAQENLDRVRNEANHSKSMWMTAEERFQILVEEVERLRMEADDTTAAWNAKESGFIGCMNISENEIKKLQQEKLQLEESLRSAKEESVRFRDIMKQAVNEATVVKEALEIARRENSQLKDLVSARENSLKTMKQDLECVKLKEANANDRINELKGVLGGDKDDSKEVENGSLATVKAHPVPVKYPSERRRSDHPHVQNVLRGGAIDLGSISERVTNPSRMRTSLSCSSDMTAASRLGFRNGDEYDQLERSFQEDATMDGDLPAKQRKKKQILQKFSELLKRGRHTK